MRRLLSKFKSPPNYRSFLPKLTPIRSTPTFVINLKTVNSRLTDLKKYLKKYPFKSKIAFSFKTNYEFAKSIFLHDHHLLAETVSLHEYSQAIALGFAPENIILNGPYKASLPTLVKSISTIHLDNFSEVSQVISQKKIKATIGIRLNSREIPSRFGFNIENGDAQKAIALLNDHHITIGSIHIHLGSDIYDPQLYKRAAKIFGKFIKSNHLDSLKTVDFGGGFPAHGQPPIGREHEICYDISTYTHAISSFYEQINYTPTLILEPGRYLIDDAVTFVTKIVDQKIVNGTQVLTLDSTINMLPSLWYRPPTISAINSHFSPLKTKIIKTLAYGSSCQEHDQMYSGPLPICTTGDIIVFYCVGAYNQSMAASFIFPSPTSSFVR